MPSYEDKPENHSALYVSRPEMSERRLHGEAFKTLGRRLNLLQRMTEGSDTAMHSYPLVDGEVIVQLRPLPAGDNGGHWVTINRFTWPETDLDTTPETVEITDFGIQPIMMRIKKVISFATRQPGEGWQPEEGVGPILLIGDGEGNSIVGENYVYPIPRVPRASQAKKRPRMARFFGVAAAPPRRVPTPLMRLIDKTIVAEGLLEALHPLGESTLEPLKEIHPMVQFELDEGSQE